MKYRERKKMKFKISLNLSLEPQKLALYPTLLNIATAIIRSLSRSSVFLLAKYNLNTYTLKVSS